VINVNYFISLVWVISVRRNRMRCITIKEKYLQDLEFSINQIISKYKDVEVSITSNKVIVGYSIDTEYIACILIKD
jgi:hypothetical protein